MQFFMFAASLQVNSVNKKLIHLSAQIAKKFNHQIDLADFSEFDLPLYNNDIQNNQGFPANVHHFVKRMHQADGLIISSPEYNFGIPGHLKNLIDWVSRLTPMPWNNQRILLLSASPSLVGGNRGLWQTRVPLEACGAVVYPNMFSLSAAYQAFDENGQLKDESQQRLENTLQDFISFVKKLS